MFQTSISLLRLLLLIQIGLVVISYAYPSSSYVIVPAADQPVSIHKRAFDRLDGADFGFWSKRSKILKRAFDRLEGTEFGFRKKRAFDRLARTDFGFRKKRSFDRITGSSFGLHKRADPEEQREALIDELAASIVALRRAHEEVEPLVVLEPVDN